MTCMQTGDLVSHLESKHRVEYAAVKKKQDMAKFKSKEPEPGQPALDSFVKLRRDAFLNRLTMLVSTLDCRPLGWAETESVKKLMNELSRNSYGGASRRVVTTEASDFWDFEVCRLRLVPQCRCFRPCAAEALPPRPHCQD